MPTRFSPAWHRGEAATFARIVGSTQASPINHDDPIHKERITRYERNIAYYLEAQYEQENIRNLEAGDFLGLRVNYTSIARRSVDQKADWLFGDPIGIHAIQLDKNGEPKPGDPSPDVTKVKNRINQIRKYNHSQFWDWVMSVMGLVCGDFFTLVDAGVDDPHPTISLLDPSYVFPDYPDNIALPMRACQIQYNIDREGNQADEESMTTIRVTEDYRLEIKDSQQTTSKLDELVPLDEDQMMDYQKQILNEEGDAEGIELICVYRRFEDAELIESSKREIGVPVIPIIHGRNAYIWNTRYGEDEINTLVPKIEKYNEMFYYAERVARMNAHAKLFLSGVRSDENPLRSDYDDVIYGGEKATAQVLSLNTDTRVLEMVTGALERELHRAASIPVIAEGEAEVGYGAPSGLALLIRFGPLQSITKRHQTTYGDALDAIYTLALIFDEMVIQGKSYKAVYDYEAFEFKYDWKDQMPRNLGEIISDMVSATGGKPLISARSAREKIPGIDPDQELERIRAEAADASQESTNTPTNPGEANNFDNLPFDQTPPPGGNGGGTTPTPFGGSQQGSQGDVARRF